ncbi:MAG: flippase [Patescibacteria group bacterium]
MSYSVAQNTSFLTSASILQKIISFAYFTLIARLIGVGNTGQYFFAITFTTIFTVVADFGLGPVLTREAARYPENSGKYINTIFWTKILFGLGAFFLVFFFINLLNYPIETKHLVYLSGVTMFFDNLHSAFYSIFRARKNLIYESIGIVGSQLATLIIGTAALFLHWPLIWLIAAYTIPSCLNFIYSAYFARRVYALPYGFSWDPVIFKTFIALALPFAVAGLVSRLYSYSDSLIMSKMLGRNELGWWSVPYKIAFAFQFIPMALSASVYPVMSEFFLRDKTKISELFAKSWRYLFLIVFPLSFGLIALAHPIITKIYHPDYLPSVPVLKILMVSLIFGYMGFITGALLNATNNQKTQTGLLGSSLVINVILNLILLPRLGIVGAAISALVSNTFLCLGGYFFSSRVVKINHGLVLKHGFSALWPAAIMGVAVYYLSFKINFLLTIPLGMLLYGVLIFVSGGLSQELIKKVMGKVFVKNV